MVATAHDSNILSLDILNYSQQLAQTSEDKRDRPIKSFAFMRGDKKEKDFFIIKIRRRGKYERNCNGI